MTWVPSQDDSPYTRLGGDEGVRKLVARFYDVMDAQEPALARLHELDEQGKVSPGARERFALFLIEWLGGPATYSPVHGHPRLRMRHARVPVNVAMRDAWLRCMARAMADQGVTGEERDFLDKRFAEVADFMRNAPD
ncbi:MAG TPA: group II truncated hemoglobin [Polyangiaceae bacterium]|nr:group II truncated hemoglobin [Polyangiaceae bacterium]